MSNAPRPAAWNTRSRSWAGQDRAFGQRMSASPSFSGRSSVPHSGQWVGMTNARSSPVRASTTGPSTSGITSPALRMTTRSPISTPLRRTPSALCTGARDTHDPVDLVLDVVAVLAPVHDVLEDLGDAVQHDRAPRDRQPPRPQRRVRLGL